MKKSIIIILTIATLTLTASAVLAKECFFPPYYGDADKNIQVERTIFKTIGVFIVVENYTVSLEGFGSPYSELHYRNIVDFAKKRWELLDETKIRIADILDENGNPRKYVLINIGAMVLNNRIYPIGDKTVFRTCVGEKPKESYYETKSGKYDDLVTMVEDVIIPKFAVTKQRRSK